MYRMKGMNSEMLRNRVEIGANSGNKSGNRIVLGLYRQVFKCE